jgi:hypothetical protein
MKTPTVTSLPPKNRDGRSRPDAVRIPGAEAAQVVARWRVAADGRPVRIWSVEVGDTCRTQRLLFGPEKGGSATTVKPKRPRRTPRRKPRVSGHQRDRR